MDRWFAERGDCAHACHPAEAVRVIASLPMQEACKPDDDEEMRLLKGKGQEHEERVLQDLRKQGLRIEEFGRDADVAATVAAMRARADVIYQAPLELGDLAGRADFLGREQGTSDLGEYHYIVRDAKLARSAKPHFLVQLCAYAEMLEEMQGCRPPTVEVILGTGQTRSFTTNSFFYYYMELKRAFLAFQRGFDPAKMPDAGLYADHGRWSTYAQRLLTESDDLSLVARITRSQIRKLHDAGITTTKALAGTSVANVPHLPDDLFGRLKAQARLQIESRGKAKPLHVVVQPDPTNPRLGLSLLPPASPSDVFFDMEGFPLVEGGLEYLFGAVHLKNGKPAYRDWWAHDQVQEKRAFEGFLDWAFERWTRDPSLHIYHYAAYEVSALRRLMGRYASRESQVDQLLRDQVFVDLYTVVRQGLLIGTPGYSLKDIECLYQGKREGEVQTAAGSLVAYQRWLDSGEPQDPASSDILKEIRDYNCDDCESLVGLADWLRQVQRKAGIAFHGTSAPDEEEEEEEKPDTPARLLADRLLQQIADGKVQDPDERRVQELLAWLLEYHWREAKPVFWRMFARNEMTERELVEDFDCLGALRRTKKPPRGEKRSTVYEYEFDPDQDTKMDVGDNCFLAHDLSFRATVFSMDRDRGRVEIKVGPKYDEPPVSLSLIPDEHVSAKVIADAIYRYAEAWEGGKILSRAVDDLLHRRPPRVKDHAGGSLVNQKKELVPQVVDLVRRLDDGLLCIQGPPGSGKTYTAAAAIAQLLKDGKKVGITANSHKAILNVMRAVSQAGPRIGLASPPMLKVGKHEDDPLVLERKVMHVERSADAAGAMPRGPVLVGATAWVFSRPELQGGFDHLFIDEAGQFSLANVVGVGLSARNLVLVGDQMQLAQPIQGSHPGDSGRSGLEYLLDGHATIPDDLGVFLDKSRRMHSNVCRFISDAVYEGRLGSHDDTEKQRILAPSGAAGRDQRESGIVFVPVEHEGNSQCSEEEVQVIQKILRGLLARKVQDKDGKAPRPLGWDDILFVAPYNMQVRLLQQRLGPDAHVGSVDKFQGQEAHVVIVSMCASSLEECPRGADFLLSRNRINVAISRAKTLAVVIGCPGITAARCHTIEEMELVNLFCWLKAHSEEASRARA